MRTLRSGAVHGLVAVPPNPKTSNSGHDDPSQDKASARSFVWQADKKKPRSLRTVLAVTLSAIALIGIAVMFVSVHTTSAHPPSQPHAHE